MKERVSAVGPAVDEALKRKRALNAASALPGYSTRSDEGPARRDDFHEPLQIDVS